jgi:hypothetical protein
LLPGIEIEVIFPVVRYSRNGQTTYGRMSCCLNPEYCNKAQSDERRRKAARGYAKLV